MTFLNWDYIFSKLAAVQGGVVAYLLAVLMVAGVFMLPLGVLTGCMTQNSWRTQAMDRYCVAVEIEDTGSETWRALCSDERIYQCSRDATQPNATYCVEIR